eukprot:TRINITY_DN71068_c0_g1_i1.p2 TRINITY_DN71068_c0_g1~~TRINITY_DN71068_c0_g1_i1.p2  ORF type:complete len:300 (+),score=88.62 TRINITY_DN71068_c0_g1_i1:65-964(+)
MSARPGAADGPPAKRQRRAGAAAGDRAGALGLLQSAAAAEDMSPAAAARAAVLSGPGARMAVGLRNPGAPFARTRHNAGAIALAAVRDAVAAAAGAEGIEKGEVYSHAVTTLRPAACAAWAAAAAKEGEAQDAAGKQRTLLTKPATVAALKDSFSPLLLLLPSTFMNHSGKALAVAAPVLLGLAPGCADLGDRICVVHDDMDLPAGAVRWRPPKKGARNSHNGVASTDQAVLGLHKKYGGAPQGCHRLRLGVGNGAPLGALTADEQQRLMDALPRATEALMLWAAGAPIDRVVSAANSA